MSKGLIFDIDTFAVHDGPGIRMAVFLKGCPLTCAWCHSPESQKKTPELVYLENRCIGCRRCVLVCPHSVHRFEGDSHIIDWGSCTLSGECVHSCPAEALQIKGYWIDSAEVVEKAKRFIPFFRNSDGGITLTGGEVSAQAEFTFDVLEGCQKHGIHTAIETCGCCPSEMLLSLSRVCDLILYDLKLANPQEHKRWTGVDNELIMENLKVLPPKKTIVRVPMIPGITDTEENLANIRRFAGSCGISRIEYLPYNSSAPAKYEWLGRKFEVPL